MNINRSFCAIFLARFIACGAVIALPQLMRASLGASFVEAARVIDTRCISCHDSETREAGIDLTPLLEKSNSSYGQYTRLWVKAEEMVSRGEMPPAEDGSLAVSERAAIEGWFEQSFVLRMGEPHVGPTPLRRLTRYELENTLEDVLSVTLKPPYRDTITGYLEKSTIQSLVPSDIPGESGFDNDAHRLGSLKPPLKEISEAVHFAIERFGDDEAAKRAVLGVDAIPDDLTDDQILDFISKFLARACRSDPERVKEYAAAYQRQYQRHVEVSLDCRKSLMHVFEMILVSPDFLYRIEETRGNDTPYPVTGWELATRLSYFLWSTAPDEELLRLGIDGSLLRNDVLKSQVDRMLNSPKRLALAESFAAQWLGFETLLSNRDFFVDERWNRETYDEVLFFFDELIESDRSILDLVQSDWTYRRASALRGQRHGYERIPSGYMKQRYADVLSERENGSNKKKQRYDPPVLVKTKDDREGGIITSAAIMRLTASKNRTSPIRRGVWVLNTVIGKTLEAPPDIPSLQEAREMLALNESPSVAEVIKQHVSRTECIHCHQAIDPLGLGLENFAPTGVWRTHYPDKAPIESSGVMPNGRAFETPRQMKQLLIDIYRDEIVTNFVARLLAYALGRQLQPFDRVTLESIVSEVKKDGCKVNTAIEQIVLSPQFRYRQDD